MTTDPIIAAAEKLGAEHGRAAGTWVIDGNTTVETCRAIIAGYEDGDPGILDMAPAPLSGEWADGMTVNGLLDELVPERDGDGEYAIPGDEINDICDAYEAAYYDAFWAEVIRSAKVQTA